VNESENTDVCDDVRIGNVPKHEVKI